MTWAPSGKCPAPTCRGRRGSGMPICSHAGRSTSSPGFQLPPDASSSADAPGHPAPHHQRHEGQVTTEASHQGSSLGGVKVTGRHLRKYRHGRVAAGAYACLEPPAHLELWQEQTATEKGETGLAHSNLPQKILPPHHLPQLEVAFVHVGFSGEYFSFFFFFLFKSGAM